MNKGKRKRERKEHERLFSSERYWEWLAQATGDTGDSEQTRLRREAWHGIAKRALRMRGGFEEFITKSGESVDYPDLPDLYLLFLLKAFIEYDRPLIDESIPRGLSLPAEEISKKALSWQEELFPEKAVRKLFTVFINKPQTISKKHYQEMSVLLKVAFPYNTINTISAGIDFLRKWKQNQKRPGEFAHVQLGDYDAALKSAAGCLSPALREVFCRPFIHHMSLILRELAKDGREADIAKTISAMPFVFSEVAGERADEIKERLMHLDVGLGDVARLEKKIGTASFEEKIALVGRIASVRKGGDEAREYSGCMKRLYREILAEISKRLTTLPEREKRELPKSVGPFIARDLSMLWEEPRELDDLLRKIAEAGCLDKRLSLLALLVAKERGDNKLYDFATSCLKRSSAPDKGDISWLMREFSFLIISKIGHFKSFLELYDPKEPFVRELSDKIMHHVESALTMLTIMKKSGNLLRMLDFPVRLEDIRSELKTLRRELLLLKDFAPFAFITEYLDCYPENLLTREGHGRLIKIGYEKKGLDFLIGMMKDIAAKCSPRRGFMDDPFAMLMDDTRREQEEATFAFLKECLDDLKTASFAEVQKIYEVIIATCRDASLLMRLRNLLEYRIANGGKEFIAMNDHIWQLLEQLRAKASNRGRRRGRR